MPTLLRVEGFRFYFFSNERQEPPHVHVRKGHGKAKFNLRPVTLAVAQGMRPHELSRARKLVVENQKAFEARWNEHFSKKP